VREQYKVRERAGEKKRDKLQENESKRETQMQFELRLFTDSSIFVAAFRLNLSICFVILAYGCWLFINAARGSKEFDATMWHGRISN